MTKTHPKRNSRRGRSVKKRPSAAIAQLRAETVFGLRLIAHALVTLVLMWSFTVAHRIPDPAMRWVVYVFDLVMLGLWAAYGVIQLFLRVRREWREQK